MKNNILTLQDKIYRWKKSTKYSLAFLLVISVYLGANIISAFSKGHFNQSNLQENLTQPESQKSELVEFKKEVIESENNSYQEPQPAYGTFEVLENSMEHLGFYPGDIATEKLSNSCEVGDVCEFLCLAKRCGRHLNGNLFKTVTKKEGEKYWFEGRSGRYNIRETKKKEKDGLITTTTNWDTSFDSTNFGWMENNKDIVIEGIVIKKSKKLSD
jgi:hypothetical protein